MNASRRVDLAHEQEFTLGCLTVAPSRRELARADGAREVIEHRVMQVLVALAKANGAIVTRDELVLCCWDGRVVGDDAINRVIGRLRKSAEGIGAGSFRIETVTRIGHRLTHGPGETTVDVAARSGWRPTRRAFASAAMATAAVLAAAGGALSYRRLAHPAMPPEVEGLMQEADQALNQVTPEGFQQAIGLYRRVVEIAPDFADGWGLLGFAYAVVSHYSPGAESEALQQRAEAAARRAQELERGNANGELALATALPLVGHWLQKERGLQRALSVDPGSYNARLWFGIHLYEVGRLADALAQYGEMPALRCPAGHYGFVAALWSAGRIEEADRAMEQAASLYPTHPLLWRQRYELRAFGGRPAAAQAMMNDPEGRPSGVPDEFVAELQASARAIESRDPAAADAVIRAWMGRASASAGNAVMAMRIASALGRVDEAFKFADAYHLAPGGPDQGDGASGASDIPPEQRGTSHLFEPVTGPMRADPRFERLVGNIGLDRYWRERGAKPDYRRA